MLENTHRVRSEIDGVLSALAMKRWQILASSLSRVGSRGVKEGAAGAVHRAHGVGGQPNGVRCGAVRIIRVGVDECRPTPPQPENFVSGCDGA